jgi:hypothetical protein
MLFSVRYLAITALVLGLVWVASPAPAQDLPERIVNRWGMEFILVPAGRYAVCKGPESDEAGPGFVDLGAFYLQVTEVTRGHWSGLKADNRFGAVTKEESKLPAHGLSHGDSLNLVSKINKVVGKNIYRLAREAEW